MRGRAIEQHQGATYRRHTDWLAGTVPKRKIVGRKRLRAQQSQRGAGKHVAELVNERPGTALEAVPSSGEDDV